MRQTTLNSYLYRQYKDDDDLQALIAAYNQATQYYVDWFNAADLPYYPGLSGGQLDWVANGLYAQKRTQLASPLSAAKGMLNTLVPLNTVMPLNTFVAATQTFYNLSDDVFQRILTWNFYKGDGRHFSIRWLKRRIMRFLVGANGIDPQPMQSAFSVGCETTSAIGVVIASNIVTVSLDQSLLSLQAGVTPGILQLFQLAFQGGNLELPLGYTYVVNIITGFDALARPNVLTSSSPQLTQTTAPTSVVTLGGTGLYTYAWAIQTAGLGGIAGISSAAGGGLSTGIPLAGAAGVGGTASGQLTGALGGAAGVSSNASGTLSGAAQQALAGNPVVVSGASATFQGGAQITIDSPLSATTTFTAKGMSWGQTLTVIAVCTVTDTVSGLTTQASCTVTFNCLMPSQILTEGGSLALPLFIEGFTVPIVVEP